MKQSWLYRSRSAHVRDEAGAQAVVVGLADRAVDRAPPDLGLARRLGDDELVLGRAAGVLAGPDDERAVGGDEPLAGRIASSYSSAVDRLARTVRPSAWRVRGVAVVAIGGQAPGAQAITVDRPAARDAAREGRRSRLPQSCGRMLARCGMVSKWLPSRVTAAAVRAADRCQVRVADRPDDPRDARR